MKEEYLRTAALIGEDGLERLKNSTVAVFGLGGVGSYAAEALVRSGVGTVYIYDSDKVSKSNINRQLIALSSTVGMNKTEVAAARLRDINPECRIVEKQEFVTPDSDIPFEEFDFIIDAVDNVTAKLFLAVEAEKRKLPIISVMGTGNKLDPTRLRITDIYKTSVCPLARVMRYELKKRGVKKLAAVWSDENPIKPADCGEYRDTGRIPPASMAMVPGSAGLYAASFVIRKSIEK
ncbi:MAG: tRNA threonylcarbamoyladenosine dehydratase [Acutalibacteraceae bacterium]|nr:tRNA threonylcarbamoyladenosine dehydratase [Acutalibacteraceae bacterium]